VCISLPAASLSLYSTLQQCLCFHRRSTAGNCCPAPSAKHERVLIFQVLSCLFHSAGSNHCMVIYLNSVICK
jgi:hypothetical protein